MAGTVAEDISYGLCNLELPRGESEKKLERAIADFHRQDLRDRPLHHLSLGYQSLLFDKLSFDKFPLNVLGLKLKK